MDDLAALCSALAKETTDADTQNDLVAAAYLFRDAATRQTLANNQDAATALQNLATRMQGEAQHIHDEHVFWKKLSDTLISVWNSLNPFDGAKIAGLVDAFLKP